MPSFRAIIAAFACFTLIACAGAPTVEDVNAQQAKNNEACEAKGYLHDTEEFQTCLNLIYAQEQSNKANVMRGPGAAGFGVAGFPSDERLKRDIEPVAHTIEWPSSLSFPLCLER